jgi:hypothetical protein
MRLSWLASCVLFSVSLSPAADPYKVEAAGPCANPEVSQAMKDQLQPQGVRVVGDSGVFVDVWLRKVLPQSSAGTDYSTLANGTFAGVIVYTNKGGDYRGQAIKPGAYVMRYQAIPSDGNHMGVSPTPAFFLLTPGAADQDPESIPDPLSFVTMSKKAAGTNHPAVLHLNIPSGGDGQFHSDDSGHWTIETKTRARPSGGSETDFPVAIILVEKSEG